MKPLSFKEWYERLHNCRIYYKYVSIEYVERYAQYRAKLAWDEAAKAQRESDQNFLPCTCDAAYKDRNLSSPDCPQCSYGVIDNELVEYKETLWQRKIECQK